MSGHIYAKTSKHNYEKAKSQYTQHIKTQSRA